MIVSLFKGPSVNGTVAVFYPCFSTGDEGQVNPALARLFVRRNQFLIGWMIGVHRERYVESAREGEAPWARLWRTRKLRMVYQCCS